MKFILHAPIDAIHPKGDWQSGEGAREIARAIERSGADGAFLTEHPAPETHWLHNDPGGHDTLDPFVALAFLAAVTTRLMVVSNIICLPFRNPFITAKAAATLQVLSDNRFIMGVGVGYQKEEFDALGVPFKERGALTDEALETIRLAWKGGSVVKKGRYFNAVGNEPRPIPSPPPPIWVGGGSDKALERAANSGDGWMPYFTQPTLNPELKASSVDSMETFAKKVKVLKDRRYELGKTGQFDIVVGSPFRPKTITRTDSEKFLGIAHELQTAGATWISAILRSSGRASYLEKVAWFGEEIIAPFNAK